MYGHADLIGPTGLVDEYDLTETGYQGELFAELRPQTAQLPTLHPSALGISTLQLTGEPSPIRLADCACVRSLGGNDLDASRLPELDASERARFFENCLSAQESERLKLGRELHDSTGQLLLALRLEIAHLRQVNGMTEEGSLLDEIEETVREIDREIRAFAFIHYPAEVGREGLDPALRSLARGFASRTGLRIRFSSIPDPIVRTGAVALALLRVAQEALLNVHRHARALHVDMALTLRRGMLELAVRDDGVGIQSEHILEESCGVGLQGMRHRVERLGGHFAIRRLKRGTKIVAAVPA